MRQPVPFTRLAGLLLGLAWAGMARGNATFDAKARTIFVQGPGNTLDSIACDLVFPDYFRYDFAARTAECAVPIAIIGDGELMIGDPEFPWRGETLRFTGDAPCTLSAAGKGLYCHHAVITGPDVGSRDRFSIRVAQGRTLILDSVIENAGSAIFVDGVRDLDLAVIQTRFERCNVPIHSSGSPPPLLAGLTFRACGALSVQRDMTLRDCVFEDTPVPYAGVGQYRGGQGTTLTLVNCTPWPDGSGKNLFYQGSRALRQWYLRARVVDAARKPVPGARVVIKDRAGRVAREAVTDAEGWALDGESPCLPVTESVLDAEGIHPAGPHRIEVQAGPRAGAAEADLSRAGKDRPLDVEIVVQ